MGGCAARWLSGDDRWPGRPPNCCSSPEEQAACGPTILPLQVEPLTLIDRELQVRVAGRPVLLAPKMRVLDSLEPASMPGLTREERDYAFRAHFDVVLVDVGTFKPVAAVELDGRQHETDPLTMARDRLKNSLCEKAGLPLVRVRWGTGARWRRLMGCW